MEKIQDKGPTYINKVEKEIERLLEEAKDRAMDSLTSGRRSGGVRRYKSCDHDR